MSLDLPVMDVCCAAVSFDIFPPLAVDETNSKTSLTWGSAMGFHLVLALSVMPPLSFCLSLFYCVLTDFQELVCKKPKVDEDASGLVPYGGDSSDEEEERPHCSKTDKS